MPTQDFTLSAKNLERPEGKDYHRLHFKERFTLGEYTGDQCVIWKWAASALDVIKNTVKDTPHTYRLAPSGKDPTWAPALDAILTTDGKVVWEKPKQDGRGDGRGRRGGGGDWETSAERAAKNESIEVQRSVEFATQIALHEFPAQRGDSGANAVLEWVEQAVPRIVLAHRKERREWPVQATPQQQAPAQESGSPGSATAGSPHVQEAAAKPSQVAGEPDTPSPNGDEEARARVLALNKAISRFKTRAALEAAYTAFFNEKQIIEHMSAAELSSLLSWDEDGRPPQDHAVAQAREEFRETVRSDSGFEHWPEEPPR